MMYHNISLQFETLISVNNPLPKFNLKGTILWLFLFGATEMICATEVAIRPAHVHGLAELAIVQEDDSLHLELISPAINIVGFESPAKTAEQIAAVESAVSILESTRKLFSFTGVECSGTKIEVDVSVVEAANRHVHDHGHEMGKHTDGPPHDHGEIDANYSFQCREGADLTGVTVELFDQFRGIETVRVMWVTDIEQRTQTLTGDSRHIKLR